MIEFFGPLVIAVLLLSVILAWVRASSVSRDLPLELDGPSVHDDNMVWACPPEFVANIFSCEDLKFISQIGSPELEKYFRLERNGVALVWVQQTSASICKIMRQHVETSRRSRDLEFKTEARIFVQYAQIRLICAFLFVSIELLGPQRLRGLALYAHELTQRIGRARQAFDLATQENGIRGTGSV